MRNAVTIFLKVLKKLIVPIAVIIPLSLIISLFIAEKIIRYVNPQLTENEAKKVSLHVSKKSDYLPSVLKQNQKTTHYGNTHEFEYSVQINSAGYRMREFSIEKPKDEYRILMLGDSTTFGYGVEVEDNLPSKLESKLNNYLKENGIEGKKIQIINAGLADGKSIDSYYLYLNKEGLKLNPDLIIVNLFPTNVLLDIAENEWEKVDENGLPLKIVSKVSYVEDDYTRLKKEYQDWKYRIPVLKNSHLWILLATTIESKSPHIAQKAKKILNSNIPLPTPGKDENDHCIYDNGCTPRMEELYKRKFMVLNALIKLVKDANVPLIAAVIPANPQVERTAKMVEIKNEVQPYSQETLEQINNQFPQKRIKEVLDQNAIDLINPLPYVVDKNWRKYYFEKDGHATALGNEKLSQGYFDFLVQNWKIVEKLR